MFGLVWAWAGTYRRTETNIGIDPGMIASEVRGLMGDVRAWVDDSTFEPDELAVRFHRRLVASHPFANGNGRHSRIAADYLLVALGSARFSWGAGLDVDPMGREWPVALPCGGPIGRASPSCWPSPGRDAG